MSKAPGCSSGPGPGRAEDPAGVEGLGEQAVTAFLLAEASRGLSAKSLQGRVAELRSLLRFLYLQAMIATPLGEGVPPVPGWKDTGVPRRLAAAEVQALLAQLRPGHGERQAGPGHPAAARPDGAARRRGGRARAWTTSTGGPVSWSCTARPGAATGCRFPPRWARRSPPTCSGLARGPGAGLLFLTLRPPPRAMGHTTVSQVVWRQCRIAGAGSRCGRTVSATPSPPSCSSRGVRLPEIAQVLRQRDLATTAVYAKVDYSAAARAGASPWPVAPMSALQRGPGRLPRACAAPSATSSLTHERQLTRFVA